MLERLFSKFGYAKLPAPTADHEQIIAQIASGIGYDMRWYQNAMSMFWNPNPVMRSSKFTGLHNFEEMDGDAHVYSCMSTRKEANLARPYSVRSFKPGDELEDIKAAFVAWNLDHIPQIVQRKREMLSAFDYGFSVSELEFAMEDVVIPDRDTKKNGVKRTIKGATLTNAVVIKDIKTKIPSAFGFDGAGNLTMVPAIASTSGMPSYGGGGSRALTPEDLQHFLVLTHDPRFGSRYGWPLKASFFWSYLMKKAGKIFRMIFVEKYGMPFLKGTYPASAFGNTGEITTFEEKLKGLQKNSWIMTPEGFAIEFVDALSKTSTMDVYQNLMDWCDGDISEVCLGHRAAVSATAGAFASAEVKEASLRQDKLEMDALELDAVFNDQLIPRLIDANFAPNGFYPYVVTDVEPESDLNKAMFRYATASNLGLELSKSQIREDLGFREPEDEEDTLMPVGTDMSPLPNNPAGGNTGGDNMPNEQIADGTMKTKSKMSRGPGITMTVNL